MQTKISVLHSKISLLANFEYFLLIGIKHGYIISSYSISMADIELPQILCIRDDMMDR